MKLPETIPIGGLNYKIREVEKDALELDDGRLIGSIRYQDLEIVLNQELPDDLKAQTLVHEVVHGVLLSMSHEYHDNEDFVTAFSNILHQIMEHLMK